MHSRILDIIENTLDRSNLDVGSFIDLIKGSQRIFISGKGRSGLVAKAFAMRLMHVGKKVYVIGEITTPKLEENDLLIVVSRSGNILIDHDKTCLLTASGYGHRYNYFRIVLSQDDILPLGTEFELAALIFLETVIFEYINRHDIKEEELHNRHANIE